MHLISLFGINYLRLIKSGNNVQRYKFVSGLKVWFHIVEILNLKNSSFEPYITHSNSFRDTYEFYFGYAFNQAHHGLHAIWDLKEKRFVAYVALGLINWDKPFEILPEEGSDWFVKKIYEDVKQKRKPNTVAGIAAVCESHDSVLISLMANKVKEVMLRYECYNFVSALRPMGYKVNKFNDFNQYAKLVTSHNKPIDPWVRILNKHLGALVVKPCNNSMTRTASIKQWEKWTNKKFEKSGFYNISQLNFPLEIDLDKNLGKYVESGIWVKCNI